MKKRKKRKNNRDKSSSRLKISEMIVQFASDFIDMGDNLEEKQSQLNAAVSAWNISLSHGEKRAQLLNEYMESFKSYNPHLDASDFQDVRENMEKLIAEKERLFPDVKKVIAFAEIRNVDGQEHITAGL